MGKVTGFKDFKREEPQKRLIKDRIKDYKEVYKEFPEKKLQEQGARCMDCGIPFCSWGCPLGNLTPDFNDMVYRGEWHEAFRRLRLTSNFPEFTGRICPALCEGSCTLGVNSDAVSVRQIEYSIIERAFKEGWVQPNPPKVRTGKKVAVIGSGPSGLAVAAELNSVGHNVTVFERADEIGGLLRYGIPDFKLEKHVVERRVDLMKAEGIEFKVNVEVGLDYSSDKLLEEYDAVCLTCGSTIPRDLEVKGRDLEGVYFAMDFLTQQNKRNSKKSLEGINEIYVKDKKVLVIGGGDTGSDCIGTSVRQGAKEVYQYEIMPKAPTERDASMPWPYFPKLFKTTTSHEEGCVREWNILTKEFIGENGKLKKVKLAKVEWVKDENGKYSMQEIPGSEFEQEVDVVLLAMGFLHTQRNGIVEELNLELDGRGNVKADKTYMTSKKGVFAAGDMRRGQSLVVWAVHEGREAARNIDKYLMGETTLRG